MKTWQLAWAARFVAKWEGFVDHAYWDALGRVWTIGYGHTGPDVVAGQKITKLGALRLLTKDLRVAARAVDKYVKVPINVRQRIALISFTFNLGSGALYESTLLRELNKKHYRRAADEFLKWDHAGGVRVLGLTRRRRAERWMFLNG